MRLGLNLVVLVLQDNAYGRIRWKQQAADGFRDFGMTFGNPDFAAYAKAHHAKGSQVETADGLVGHGRAYRRGEAAGDVRDLGRCGRYLPRRGPGPCARLGAQGWPPSVLQD
jgi:hypothetical protein